MPDLAVLMSVYHNDKLEFVRESVESILSQTFSQFHFFLAFDGPVSKRVESYISSLRDERVKLFRYSENKGLATALNNMLVEVLQSPEYIFIARMDADDISMPSRFEKQRDFLLNNREISCVGTWYEVINEFGEFVCSKKLPLDHESLKKRYLTRTPFVHPSVMYQRQLIETAGLYPVDTMLMEDNVLWGTALKLGFKFANLPEYLLKFRHDKAFYQRRSGLKYGMNYIKTRYHMNRSLKLPVYSDLLTLFNGILRMMPSFIVRLIYIF